MFPEIFASTLLSYLFTRDRFDYYLPVSIQACQLFSAHGNSIDDHYSYPHAIILTSRIVYLVTSSIC
jgi:hypothetical protein